MWVVGQARVRQAEGPARAEDSVQAGVDSEAEAGGQAEDLLEAAAGGQAEDLLVGEAVAVTRAAAPPEGAAATDDSYPGARLLGIIEERWRPRFGTGTIRTLRGCLRR